MAILKTEFAKMTNMRRKHLEKDKYEKAHLKNDISQKGTVWKMENLKKSKLNNVKSEKKTCKLCL